MTPRFAATVLALEAFLVFFALLVAVRTVDLPTSALWAGGLALVALCVVAAGAARRPHGLVVGSAVQVLVVATGFWVPAMFVMGLVFAAMWVWLLLVGRRIDRDRARWAQEAQDGLDGLEGLGAEGSGGR